MSNIIIAKELPDNAPRWNFSREVSSHALTKETSVDPRRGLSGINQYGMPEGIFMYGRDRTVATDFVVDIDIAPKTEKLTGKPYIEILGIHLMCPRCMQPLFIRTINLPTGVSRPAHEIEVHWSDRHTAKDGYWRPTFSVGGPIVCEHEWRTSQKATPDTSGFCNWRGGIIRGRCFDHYI
jgi:hypothetical protein